MNVLIIPSFFYDKYNPTSGSFFLEQARALQSKGHNVYIAYCDTYSVKEFDHWLHYTEKNETRDGVQIFRKRAFCPLKHGSGFYGCHDRFAREIQTLYHRHLAGKKIDIIHAHCCVWAGYAAMKLSEKTGIPYVITEHSSLYSLNADQIQGKYCAMIQESFRKASTVLCVSEGLRRLIQQYRDDAKILGNVIDGQLFQATEKKKPSGNFDFFTVFYMNSYQQCYNKGCDLLLNALADIVKHYPDTRLLIGGSGSAQSVVEAWIRDRKLEDNVTLLGALSRQEVVRKLQQCDVFVLPSRYETFGVSYAEAMACGKPVIATRTGGPDSFVTEDTGILVDVENQEQLTDAMLYMVEHQDRYNSEKIRRHIEELFSMEAIANQLEETYRNVL